MWEWEYKITCGDRTLLQRGTFKTWERATKSCERAYKKLSLVVECNE